jgi:3-isopropylmalate dehydratase small subunit
MKGRVIKYEQDSIDTDVILPGPYLKLHDHDELGEHAMEGFDPNFHSKAKEATDCHRHVSGPMLTNRSTTLAALFPAWKCRRT